MSPRDEGASVGGARAWTRTLYREIETGWSDEDDAYLARWVQYPDIGVQADGETREEAVANLISATGDYFGAIRADGSALRDGAEGAGEARPADVRGMTVVDLHPDDAYNVTEREGEGEILRDEIVGKAVAIGPGSWHGDWWGGQVALPDGREIHVYGARLRASRSVETTSGPAMCVCGHARSEHESSFVDGSKLDCYASYCDCEKFLPAPPGAAPEPVETQGEREDG